MLIYLCYKLRTRKSEHKYVEHVCLRVLVNKTKTKNRTEMGQKESFHYFIYFILNCKVLIATN